jgi:protoheme IX farnesyltransferase
MWQIPHFWLIVIRHSKDYETAGFPSITVIYSETQIKGITFVWVTATAVASVLLPLMGVFNNISLKIILFMIIAALIFAFSRFLLKSSEGSKIFKYFMGINAYLLLILILIVVGVFL